MKVGIFGSSYQAGKQNAIKELFDQLGAMGAEIWVDKTFYNYLSKQFAFTPQVMGLLTPDPFPLDMAVSLGGDGTFLQTADWVGRQNIPILGINTGRLGFLADISTPEIRDTLTAIEQGHYKIEERSLLYLESPLPHRTSRHALNEIAILKRDTSSMITITASVNDELLAEYMADGLLISTPTGSTAYNLSTGGPIIYPQCNNFVITPVAPHSLNIRPLVIPEDYELRFRVESRSKNFLVSLDGRSEVYPSGTEFRIRKAEYKIRIVKRKDQTFFETLRNKLFWGTDVRNAE